MSLQKIQGTTTFADIDQLVFKHLTERDWDQSPPQNIAISIALEASELLEHYQWSSTPIGDTQTLADELADIFIYCFQFAQTEGIDIAQAIKQKLHKLDGKYPAEDFKNKSVTEQDSAWIKAKLNHKKDTL